MSRTASITYPARGALGRQCTVWANSRGLHITAFIIGLTSFVHFELIGELYPAEIVLFLMIPLLWSRKSALLRNPLVKKILFFGLIWFASQVGTDLIRSTPPSDMMRGWASISFFLMDFVGLYMLVSDSSKRLKIFLLGYAVGGLFQPVVLPNSYSIAHPWKFGYAFPITLSLLLLITYFCGNNIRKLKWWIGPLGVLGLLSFYLDFRSLGAFILLMAFLIYFRDVRVGRLLTKRFRPFYITMAAIILMGVGIGIIKIYGYSAEQGWLGEIAQQKYEMETGGKLGILLGGRPDLIPAVFAIVDSPVVGHGSWARDPYYRDFLYELLALGYNRSKAHIDYAVAISDLIPAHSHILQAWVWAGILGALFWFVVLTVVMRCAIGSYRRPNDLFVLVIFFAALSVWDIFFSPFGSFMRMQWAFRLTVLLLSYQLSKQIRRKIVRK